MTNVVLTRYRDAKGNEWIKYDGKFYVVGQMIHRMVERIDFYCQMFADFKFFPYPDQVYAQELCAGNCIGWYNSQVEI